MPDIGLTQPSPPRRAAEMRDAAIRWARLVRVLTSAGVIAPVRPDRALRSVRALARWGPSPAAGYTGAAARCPKQLALIDEAGQLTFADVHRRTNALAHSLNSAGVVAGVNVGVMCRNHRGFVETTVALSKLGAHALYLNTAFAAPQLAEVVAREKPVALVYDQEFAGLLTEAGRRRKRFIAWPEDQRGGDEQIEELIADGATTDLSPPALPGRAIVLTSGTTGTPKGATRSQPRGLDPAVSLLSRIPLHARRRTLVSAPLFHSWGMVHFTLGLLLSSTLILQRRFEPELALAAVQDHCPETLAAVPVMLQRILELPDATIERYDASSLRIVALSGSALPGDLATRFMDRFGDVLYNLYGSTEVAWATIATPEDLRAAPDTAGKPPVGTQVRIVDEHGRDVPGGRTGRIFVGNEMLFEGYSGGGDKDRLGALMASGDVGRVDSAGRLFVEGRDDEMIVSGGENVFPREVEDLLGGHEAIAEVAIIGVEDDQFGQRLKAFVVTRTGSQLSSDEVKAYVKANLAGYKTPRDVEFIDQLPRNATGKVVKRQLAGHHGRDGPPANDGPS